MEVALSAQRVAPEPLRRGTPRPLSQLVEERENRAKVPNCFLDSKMFAKVKSNRLIQAEPPELHFSGFELGKDSTKILKLINISSEVVNIHIIPTQTKHFQTTYTKKCRLIPGLAYTVKVRFCPDEWRYFYDCVRVHCQGEENLLVPVHAYPVIDDLNMPPHINLPAVPLGQSVRHAIPLRCSSPIDFEFQVYVIEPHKAFSIHPLTGVIPANGEESIMVTFSPFQYETCQVTFQLSISQFNSRPHLCTITGSSAPHLALSDPGRRWGHGGAAPAEHKGLPPAAQVPPRRKTKSRSTKEVDKSKALRDRSGVKGGPRPQLDVCSPAGVMKLLIKDPDKLSSKDLREAASRGGTVGPQNRQTKEALFLKKVRQNVKEEQGNHLRWQVHLGKDPVSEHSRRQIVEEREMALHEYMVKMGDIRGEDDFASGQPKLSSRRVLREAGQACEGAPSFQFYSDFPWELKLRALKVFQQAARKVVIRCRLSRRLTCLKEVSHRTRSCPLATKVEEDLKISPARVFPFEFPVFSSEEDPLTGSDLAPLPVDPVDVTVTAQVPFFKLQVPQHYQLMGYQPVSTWEAFNSYIPPTLARPLRTGAPDEPEPKEAKASVEVAHLSFSAPDALLTPFPANPLRIFNPAPGLQAYKPTPKYLETDPEFHLCPMPRYPTPESSGGSQSPHALKTTLDHQEVIPGLMKWKDFRSITSKSLSERPSLTSAWALHRSVDYSTDILPLSAPPPLPPPDGPATLMDKKCESSGVQLTPEIIRAQFLSGGAPVANSNHTRGTAARHQLQTEATSSSQLNQMGKRVTTRLKQLRACAAREDRE